MFGAIVSHFPGSRFTFSDEQRRDHLARRKDESHDVQAVGQDLPARAPGKSIKKLLKENKKLSGMPVHERIPDSNLFVMSLKGHSAAVLSLDISSDASRVVTTCADHVRTEFSCTASCLKILYIFLGACW